MAKHSHPMPSLTMLNRAGGAANIILILQYENWRTQRPGESLTCSIRVPGFPKPFKSYPVVLTQVLLNLIPDLFSQTYHSKVLGKIIFAIHSWSIAQIWVVCCENILCSKVQLPLKKTVLLCNVALGRYRVAHRGCGSSAASQGKEP